MFLTNINHFIISKITRRNQSLFQQDIERFSKEISKEVSGNSVLVIGGAGTIGSSFIKAVLDFEPGKLVVVDTNENGLTELTRDLRSKHEQFVPDQYFTYPMNFGDPVFQKMFLKEGPFEIVANFAAHKHVRSEKDVFSIEAMVDNNVVKAKGLMELLRQHPPKHFFCVSTDKAANPVNVMGASKKLMEEMIMAYSSYFPVTTARFANVAFSNGSLLDGYIQRIFKNQPISCPSDVLRFFVSPEESGQICMLACVLGKSGEIFFPKLKQSDMVSFKEITLDFFKTLGLEIQICKTEDEARKIASRRTLKEPYPVYFIPSDTSGEKLYEEFFTESDELDNERFRGLGVIVKSRYYEIKEVEAVLNDLLHLFKSDDVQKADVVALLQKYLPNFEHIETGKSLDQKM
ncbi:MAG: hypothetical protein RL264_3117 [Bacteroidota bacterium]|jgi:FlaA1/EpsC-like NDP-sugar epimerase